MVVKLFKIDFYPDFIVKVTPLQSQYFFSSSVGSDPTPPTVSPARISSSIGATENTIGAENRAL